MLALRCSPGFSSRGLDKPIKVHVCSFQTTSHKIKMNQSGNSNSVSVRNDQLSCYQMRGSRPGVIFCILGTLETAFTDFLPQLEYFTDVKGVVSSLLVWILSAMGHLDPRMRVSCSTQPLSQTRHLGRVCPHASTILQGILCSRLE